MAALKPVLDREGVVAASVFGSRATGREHGRSDLDVAIWLDPELPPGSASGCVSPSSEPWPWPTRKATSTSSC